MTGGGPPWARCVGLTAHRPLTAQEQARAEAEAETSEWQNLLREMTEAFGPPAPRPPATADPPATFQAALDREFATRDGGAFRILVAPSPEPGRRANTGDSVTYLARQVPPAARRRVLLVTSAIYAPYQFFLSAPRLLAAGTRHVELVGSPTSTTTHLPVLTQRIAQEIHSAATAASHLWRTR